LRTFSDHGVAFTIATDGPEMMQTHLRDEFELLLRVGALDEDELRAANARAHAAAFLPSRRSSASASASSSVS
jgi:adenosine deaminase